MGTYATTENVFWELKVSFCIEQEQTPPTPIALILVLSAPEVIVLPSGAVYEKPRPRFRRSIPGSCPVM